MVKGNKEKRRVYRLPPCPAYDVEGMESWLADMARDGLLLCRDGFFAGFAAFERADPQDTRGIKYRLEAAEKSTSMWADDGGEPDAEAVEISEKYGWEYIAKRCDFYIYRSSDPAARELNTDPVVQALALNTVRKRQRSAALSCLFWTMIYPIIAIRGNLFITMIGIRTWYFLFGAALLFWYLAASIGRALHLGRLRKKLLNDGTIDHGKNWRKRVYFYHAGTVIRSVLTIIWACILLQKWGISASNADKIPLSDYAADPPFATIADLSPGGEYSEDDYLNTNKVSEWSDWLSKYNIDWSEIASVRRSDGTILSGGLYVDYHEAASPWIAEKIAREYVRTDRRNRNFDPLELPALDVDFAVAYTHTINLPTVVLRDGNKVIHATFYQASETYIMPLEEWVDIMIKSIKS